MIFFNFNETMIALAYILLPLFLGLFHALLQKQKSKTSLLFNYMLFIGVGIQGVVTGIVQMVFPEAVVNAVGWPYSLFLLELGMANFSFGIVGLIAPWRSFGFKAASALGYGLFLLITGFGHLIEMWLQGVSKGNLGGFLFSDILVGFFLILLLIETSA